MRKEETLGMFKDFDDLFGNVNIFSRSHEVFNPCFWYLADGSLTPRFHRNGQMIIEPGIWTDHLGGMEGMRQKPWTIFTVILLKIISDRIECVFPINALSR